MRTRIEKRRDELKAELEKGRAKLAELEGQATAVRAVLLRISGALQVLEEELAAAETAPSGA